MKSAHAKKMDQLNLSRDELKKDGEDMKLARIAGGMSAAFKAVCIATFGARWWKRLVYTSNARNRTPLGYALDVLLK